VIAPHSFDVIRPLAGRTVIVTTVASDAHTWNLVFLQLLLEELGYRVVNLGACVPDELIISECHRLDPVLVVVSTINGHGYQDGARLIRRLRAERGLHDLLVVIGGRLGVDGGAGADRAGALQAAGYDAVFDDLPDGMVSFRRFVECPVRSERRVSR
jgi:methylaspartate mutase sigma subunit